MNLLYAGLFALERMRVALLALAVVILLKTGWVMLTLAMFKS